MRLGGVEKIKEVITLRISRIVFFVIAIFLIGCTYIEGYEKELNFDRLVSYSFYFFDNLIVGVSICMLFISEVIMVIISFLKNK